MKSDQERLIKALAENSFGAPFIFAPQEYYKGKARREPCDIVWVANDCIVLMFLCRKQFSTDLRKNEQNRKKAITHNINQAKGFLNSWRRDRFSIQGRNRYQTFDISYGQYTHIVILSVIGCGDGKGYCYFESEYHHIEAANLDVTACISIPQEALQFFSQFDGTMFDLMMILNCIRANGDEIFETGTNTLGVIKSYFMFPILNVESRDQPINTEELTRIRVYLKALRNGISHIVVNDGRERYVELEFFNDLPWEINRRILNTLFRCTEKIGPEGEISMEALSVRNAEVLLTAGSISNSEGIVRRQINHWESVESSEKHKLEITYFLPLGFPVLRFKEGNVTSNTKQLLDSILQESRKD
jgi:hypothetical protein